MAEFGLETGFKLIPAIILAAILILFIVVGILSRVKSVEDYWVAGRGIGPIANGAAVASNWMSAASFLGMAGVVYLQGYGFLSYVIGWTGGFTGLSLVIASKLRRYREIHGYRLRRRPLLLPGSADGGGHRDHLDRLHLLCGSVQGHRHGV